LNIAMSYFVFSKLKDLQTKRYILKNLSTNLKTSLQKSGRFEISGDYNLLSILLKSNQKALFFQQKLQQHRLFIPAIKSPTVPKDKACLRLSICTNTPQERLESLPQLLEDIENEYLSQSKIQ
ncbi:MAG: aminotransferase class I/II-fold pyridoxal phosphate-dependent enzyme, partial [Helicobacter sp.]|nr:aminotransferase class I/II-fold pyridoxal phosphate-dependent enzyme [Helicobacter sp.]